MVTERQNEILNLVVDNGKAQRRITRARNDMVEIAKKAHTSDA